MLTDVDKFIIDVQPSLIHVSHVSHFSVILQTSCKSKNTLTTVYAVTFALFCWLSVENTCSLLLLLLLYYYYYYYYYYYR